MHSSRPRFAPRVLAAALLGLAALALVPFAVSAHFAFLAATPVPGSTIGQPPRTVKVRFDQTVNPALARIELLDTTGATVAGGTTQRDPADPTTLMVEISPLKPGLYTVAWQGVGADGHTVRGNYPFTLATSGPPAPAVPQSASAGSAAAATAISTATSENPSPFAVLVRWLRLGATGLLVGVFALVVLVLRPLAATDGSEREGGAYWRRVAALASPVAVAGVAAFLAMHLLTLLMQAGSVGDATRQPFSAALVGRVLTETEYGFVWRVIAVCALAVVAVMVAGFGNRSRRVTLGVIATARRPASPAATTGVTPPVWPWVAGFAASLLLVASLTLSSHAVESQHEPLLALIADAAHLGAMGVWFGGLLALLLVLPRLLAPLAGEARDGLRAAVIARFSPVGLWGVAALLVTGVYAMTIHVTRETVTTTSYGAALLLKHALVVPLVAAAALNLLVVRPRLARGAARAKHWLPRLLYIEAGLGVAVLLVTASLSQLPPAHPLNGTNAAAADPRLSRAVLPAAPVVALGPDADLISGPQSVAMVHDPDVMVTLRTTSGRDGGTLNALLWDAKTVPLHGDNRGVTIGIDPKVAFEPKQLTDVQRVTAILTFAGADIGTRSVELMRDPEGEWVARGQFFPIRGEWNIQVAIRRENVVEDARLNFEFTSDPARYAAVPPAAPAESATPAATGLRFPRVLPNGVFGLSAVLIGGGLFALTLAGRTRRTMSDRTAGLFRVWTLGALLVGTVTFGYFSVDVTPTSDRRNPLPNNAATLAQGQQVFMQNCAACHGSGGGGDGPLAASLNPRPAALSAPHAANHTDGDIYYWVTRGIPGSAMPAFSGTLSEQETWAAIRYVRSLQGR